MFYISNALKKNVSSFISQPRLRHTELWEKTRKNSNVIQLSNYSEIQHNPQQTALAPQLQFHTELPLSYNTCTIYITQAGLPRSHILPVHEETCLDWQSLGEKHDCFPSLHSLQAQTVRFEQSYKFITATWHKFNTFIYYIKFDICAPQQCIPSTISFYFTSSVQTPYN